MKVFLEEYGGFIVELVSGSAVLISFLTFVWPTIRNAMDAIAYMLV